MVFVMEYLPTVFRVFFAFLGILGITGMILRLAKNPESHFGLLLLRYAPLYMACIVYHSSLPRFDNNCLYSAALSAVFFFVLAAVAGFYHVRHKSS